MRPFPPKRRFLLVLATAGAAALVAGSLARTQAPPTSAAALDRPVTAIIVRHAERATSDPTDPPLDSIGRVRAEALRAAIADAGVTAIYVTQYRRTQETAAPLARALGLEPRLLPTTGGAELHSRLVAETLLQHHRGEVVLVVGHSNTIGRIARALGADARAELEDTEYEHLYVVSADGIAPTRFVRARYGPPNPATAPAMR